MKSFINRNNAIYYLLVFAPISIIINYFHADSALVFTIAVIALIPLSKLVGDTTEHLAEHFGVTGGSLINVTFSNVPEIILSIIAIRAGLFGLVKAAIDYCNSSRIVWFSKSSNRGLNTWRNTLGFLVSASLPEELSLENSVLIKKVSYFILLHYSWQLLF